MPQINQPYYNLHQLALGQYTDGNEYVFSDGTDYIGLYYVTPNGQRFTGARPEPTSKQLFIKRATQTNDSLVYNKITLSENPNYVNPVLFVPIPNTEDYSIGRIQRYFVQKRNQPDSSIVEINGEQYNGVNVTNRPGINGVIWNKTLVWWQISKLPPNDASLKNKMEIERVITKFKGLDVYLGNLLEFYR
jgi:hypothetical protein